MSSVVVTLSLADDRVTVIGVEGESVQLLCDRDVADPPEVVWKDWVYNSAREAIQIAGKNGNINQDHPQKDNYEVDIVKHQLTIKSFKKDDAGMYFCTSKYNKTTVLKKTFTVTYIGGCLLYKNELLLGIGSLDKEILRKVHQLTKSVVKFYEFFKNTNIHCHTAEDTISMILFSPP